VGEGEPGSPALVDELAIGRMKVHAELLRVANRDHDLSTG